ncbi:sensor histidine kinase [Clostridium carnis]
MEIKKSMLYKRVFLLYTSAIIFLLVTLDIFFIQKSIRDVRNNNLFINEKIVYDVNKAIGDITNNSNDVVNNMYSDYYVTDDIINFLNTDRISYLMGKLDKFSESKSYYYKGIENFTQRCFRLNENLKEISFISYGRGEISTFNRQNQINVEPLKTNSLTKEYSRTNLYCEKNTINYIREIREPINLKPQGAIILKYNLEFLNNIINKYDDLFEVMILQGNGYVVYDSLEKYEYEYYPYFDNLMLGISEVSLQKPYYISKLSDSSGLITVGKIKKEEAGRLAAKFYGSIIFVDILLFIIVEYILFIKFKKLSDRMDKILVVMDEVKGGNVEVSIPLGNEKDEISLISERFNDMCKQLNDYIKRSYLAEISQKESEINQKKAELIALQNQINPHFLYNTLESIRMKAICNGDKEVGKMLYVLAFLFRSQLKEKNIISIKNELEYCKKYLEIFKFRYDEKFEFEVICPDELLNKQIIKFTLQPLIENYFVHGIGLENKDNKLIIVIEKIDEDIIIGIKDNGRGIDKDKINEINKRLKSRDGSGKSIGILNAHERIVITYGENYGIKIEEEVVNGTIIKVKLPCKEVE